MENNTNNKITNEDHFGTDEIAAIKGCTDSQVKDYYRSYLTAEASGDTARADQLAAAIRQRCKLIGVITENAAPQASRTKYQSWHAKMAGAGATVLEADALLPNGDVNLAESTIVRAMREVGRQLIQLGEYDLIQDREVFESTDLLQKYTQAGNAVDENLWKEYVLAEGATNIVKHGSKRVAYLGEVRIGEFKRIRKTIAKKNFTDIMNESMSVNLTADEAGGKSVSVSATDGDADQLLAILKLGGISLMGSTGDEECCGGGIEVDEPIEEYSNEPNPRGVDADTQLNKMSGGLNRPKQQVNPNNPGDNPKAMPGLGKKGSGQVNIEEAAMAKSFAREFARFNESFATPRKNDMAPKPVTELSPQTRRSYMDKVADDSQKNPADPTRRPDAKRSKSVKGFAKAFNKTYLDPKKDSVERKPTPGEEVITEVDPEVKQAAKAKSSLNKRLGLVYAESKLGAEINKIVSENVELEGNIGDQVVIVGNVNHAGERGIISDFGSRRAFVVVDLYNHGKASFHSSNVKLDDSDEDDEEDLYDSAEPMVEAALSVGDTVATDDDDTGIILRIEDGVATVNLFRGGNIRKKLSKLTLEVENDEDNTESEFYVILYDMDENTTFVGGISQGSNRWEEFKVAGTAPYNWGSRYMSYLTPDQVMDYINRDYGRGYEVSGPFGSREEAIAHARREFGPVGESTVNEDAEQKLDESVRNLRRLSGL